MSKSIGSGGMGVTPGATGSASRHLDDSPEVDRPILSMRTPRLMPSNDEPLLSLFRPYRFGASDPRLRPKVRPGQ